MSDRSRPQKLVQLILPIGLAVVLTAAMLLLFDHAGPAAATGNGYIGHAGGQAWHPSGFRWITETVDTSGGASPSMVLDDHLGPHIAYDSGSGLYYTVLSGTVWTKELVSAGFGEVVP